MHHLLFESKEWYNEKLALEAIKSLKNNNISGLYVRTEEDALEKCFSLIPSGCKVGYGGSLTLEQVGVFETLQAGNYEFIDRRRTNMSEEEKNKLRKESLLADVFLMSTNALTLDGKLVNIDGIGSRVSALIFGPSRVIIVAGINKVVPDIDAAVHRIKNYVAPIHARRGNRPLPCAKTGKCVDCHSPERICNSIVVIEHQYERHRDRIVVIIVGKELGL